MNKQTTAILLLLQSSMASASQRISFADQNQVGIENVEELSKLQENDIGMLGENLVRKYIENLVRKQVENLREREEQNVQENRDQEDESSSVNPRVGTDRSLSPQNSEVPIEKKRDQIIHDIVKKFDQENDLQNQKTGTQQNNQSGQQSTERERELFMVEYVNKVVDKIIHNVSGFLRVPQSALTAYLREIITDQDFIKVYMDQEDQNRFKSPGDFVIGNTDLPELSKTLLGKYLDTVVQIKEDDLSVVKKLLQNQVRQLQEQNQGVNESLHELLSELVKKYVVDGKPFELVVKNEETIAPNSIGMGRGQEVWHGMYQEEPPIEATESVLKGIYDIFMPPQQQIDEEWARSKYPRDMLESAYQTTSPYYPHPLYNEFDFQPLPMGLSIPIKRRYRPIGPDHPMPFDPPMPRYRPIGPDHPMPNDLIY